MSILDTIVVRFGEDVASSIAADFFSKIILDDALNGEDKTSFNPGDSCYLIAQLQPGFKIDRITYTSGETAVLGTVTRSYTQRFFFPDKDTEESLAFYPSSGLSPRWFGKDGVLTRKDLAVKISKAPAIGDISYSYSAYSIRITPPNLSLGENDDWPIGIVIWVTK